MSFEKIVCPLCRQETFFDNEKEEGFCNACGGKIQKTTNRNVEYSNTESLKNQVLILQQHFDSKEVSTSIERGDYWQTHAHKFKNIVEKMQELDASSPYYHLWNSIVSFHKGRNTPYAVEYSAPSAVCRERSETITTKPRLFSLEKETTTVRYYEPMTYDEWKEKHSASALHDIRRISYFIDNDAFDYKTAISQFSYWFVRFSMNYNLFKTNKPFDIKKGQVLFYNQSGGMSYHGFRSEYNNGYRTHKRLCVADNIIDFFIPFLEENFRSSKTPLLLNALLIEYVGGVGHLGASGLDTCGGKTGQPRRGDWTLT